MVPRVSSPGRARFGWPDTSITLAIEVGPDGIARIAAGARAPETSYLTVWRRHRPASPVPVGLRAQPFRPVMRCRTDEAANGGLSVSWPSSSR